MIPHKSCKFCCILDLSFGLKVQNKKIESVNLSTALRAPQKSMAHLDHVINRIFYLMADNHNKNQPFYFSKCDIKDGFWRMMVSIWDAWNFAYVLPTNEKTTTLDETEIIIPHALQMGWSESPPYFCTATETGWDVIEFYYNNCTKIPTHPDEAYLTKKIITNNKPTKEQLHKTTTSIEVYVDAFIACTNNATSNHI